MILREIFQGNFSCMGWEQFSQHTWDWASRYGEGIRPETGTGNDWVGGEKLNKPSNKK